MYELDISHIAGGKIGGRQSAAKLSAQVTTNQRVLGDLYLVALNCSRIVCSLASIVTMAECCQEALNGLKRRGCLLARRRMLLLVKIRFSSS